MYGRRENISLATYKENPLTFMNNLIKLSETKDYIYSLVLLPRDAENVNKLERGMCLWYSISNEPGEKGIHIGDFELIGELSLLTEEQARGIVESNVSRSGRIWYRDYRQEDVFYHCLTALESLHSLIESLGVVIKNPYEKPVSEDFISGCSTAGCTGELNLCLCFSSAMDQWQQAESELKKVVIIKSNI